MKIEYRYNENFACGMRGTEYDVPSQTVTFNSTSEKRAVLKILNDVWDEFDVEDFNETFEDEDNPYTFKNLTQWASEMDISGGSSILFYINVDGKIYEADDEANYDFDFEDDEDDEDDEDESCSFSQFNTEDYPNQFAELQKVMKTSILCRCLGAFFGIKRSYSKKLPCIIIHLPVSKGDPKDSLIYSSVPDFEHIDIYTYPSGKSFYDIGADEVDKYLIEVLKKYNPSAAEYYSNKIKEESKKESLKESEIDLLNLAQFASLTEIDTVLEVHYEGRPCGTIKTYPFGKHDFSKLYMFNGTDNEAGIEAWNFYKNKLVDYVEAVGKKFICVHLK